MRHLHCRRVSVFDADAWNVFFWGIYYETSGIKIGELPILKIIQYFFRHLIEEYCLDCFNHAERCFRFFTKSVGNTLNVVGRFFFTRGQRYDHTIVRF
jgi:hypothetical protein